MDTDVDLEELFTRIPARALWFHVQNPSTGATTSFRSEIAAEQLKTRLELRWQEKVRAWSSEALPGYE